MGRIVTVTERPGPKARAWVERDEAVVSPSYTRAYPFVIARGEGAVVWDVDGNSYIDLNAGIAVCSTGHSHPKVVRAIQEQAARFLHMSSTDFYVPNQVELAERLAEIAPWSGPARVFFTNSGAEAVEAAMKLARYVTRRPAFIVCDPKQVHDLVGSREHDEVEPARLEIADRLPQRAGVGGQLPTVDPQRDHLGAAAAQRFVEVRIRPPVFLDRHPGRQRILEHRQDFPPGVRLRRHRVGFDAELAQRRRGFRPSGHHADPPQRFGQLARTRTGQSFVQVAHAHPGEEHGQPDLAGPQPVERFEQFLARLQRNLAHRRHDGGHAPLPPDEFRHLFAPARLQSQHALAVQGHRPNYTGPGGAFPAQRAAYRRAGGRREEITRRVYGFAAGPPIW